MAKRYFEYDLPNGIHLIVQPMLDFQSAAYTVLVPGAITLLCWTLLCEFRTTERWPSALLACGALEPLAGAG